MYFMQYVMLIEQNKTKMINSYNINDLKRKKKFDIPCKKKWRL